MKEDMLKIINHFGVNTQMKKFNEECYELIEAIRDGEHTRYIGVSNDIAEVSKKHIMEEMADVLNLLQQFVFYYGIEQEEFEEQLQFKVKRTLARIEEGYYEKD